MLFKQAVCLALAFAFANAGNNMLANMAMIAITTNSSMSVNARTSDQENLVSGRALRRFSDS
jgi:hypothetical protein